MSLALLGNREFGYMERYDKIGAGVFYLGGCGHCVDGIKTAN